MKRGQSQLEFFMMLVLAIGLVLPISYVTVEKMGESLKYSQAEDSVRSVVLTANSIISLGPGNKKSVTLNIPKGVSSSYQDNNFIVSLGEETFSKEINAEIIGEFPEDYGMQTLDLQVVESNIVKIGNMPYISNIHPSCLVSPSVEKTVIVEGYDFEENFNFYVNSQLRNEWLGNYNDEGSFEILVSDTKFPVVSNADTIYVLEVENPDLKISNSYQFVVVLNQANCDSYK